MRQRRLFYIFLVIATVVFGLLSRADFIPTLIYPYLGDVLYALMVFFLLGLLFPSMYSIKLTLLAIIICFLIELSQLYQADWINALRNTRLGGLLLGYGFLWSDLVSYFIGGLLGFSIELFLVNKYTKSPNN
ncbi:MAG: DUF2809 domain-containing protein [Flavobacteriaceae bacterium]|nr:DUF2809 domain-containing protein [Flavobacteriaceae bacterium]